MSDLISREAAMAAVQNVIPYVIDKGNGQCGVFVYKADVMTKLSALPSADRPKGEWIPHTTSVGLKHYIEYARCSECGEMALISMNFCPNCGADMKPK